MPNQTEHSLFRGWKQLTCVSPTFLRPRCKEFSSNCQKRSTRGVPGRCRQIQAVLTQYTLLYSTVYRLYIYIYIYIYMYSLILTICCTVHSFAAVSFALQELSTLLKDEAGEAEPSLRKPNTLTHKNKMRALCTHNRRFQRHNTSIGRSSAVLPP